MCAAGARGAREARYFPILNQNLILRGVFEVTFVDMTNRLAAMQQTSLLFCFIHAPEKSGILAEIRDFLTENVL